MFNASMNFALGEEVESLREMVHRWAQERVAPMAAEIDQSNCFPAELWQEMGELGLLGITVGDEYGGADMGYLAHTPLPWKKLPEPVLRCLCHTVHIRICV